MPKGNIASWVRLASLAAGAAMLVGCAQYGPPSNVEHACAIVAERADWGRALQRSHLKWGAPPWVQLAIIRQESSFRHDAAPPATYFLGIIPTGRASSAYGYSQAIDGTWDWYRKETGSPRASREDFEDSADFVGWYMAKSRASNGIAMNDAYNQYLAYHEGHAGWSRGSFRSKAWLVGVAKKVARNAEIYRLQMDRCR